MNQHHLKRRKPVKGAIRSKFQTPKVVFVDVDGTLLLFNPLHVNAKLVEWLKVKKQNGFELVLWSARGEQHAKQIAGIAEIEHLFSHFLSKPGYIVDDKNWRWTSFVTKVKVPK